jgi:hypothetical protein
MRMVNDTQLRVAEDICPPAIRDLVPMVAGILGLLPLPEGQLDEALGGRPAPSAAPSSFDGLADLCRSKGARIPFRIIRRAGVVVAVAPDSVRTFDIITTAAVRMVQHRGLASVPDLARRAETLASTSVSVAMVGRVLAASPRTRWLDVASPRTWFSFAGNGSRATTALRKIFSISASVSTEDLRSALGKCFPELMEAPTAVLQRYLVGVGGCTVQGAVVRRDSEAPLGAAALSVPEAKLVRILAAHGGEIESASLREHAARSGLSDATLTQLLRFSPLVVRTQNEQLCLIGDRDRVTAPCRAASGGSGKARARQPDWPNPFVRPFAALADLPCTRAP